MGSEGQGQEGRGVGKEESEGGAGRGGRRGMRRQGASGRWGTEGPGDAEEEGRWGAGRCTGDE